MSDTHARLPDLNQLNLADLNNGDALPAYAERCIQLLSALNKVSILERRLAEVEAANQRYADALKRITEIEDKLCGGDWDEIIEARAVAREALRPPEPTEAP